MNWSGLLQCTAIDKHGCTMISDCYYEGAFKLIRPVYLHPSQPTIYLIHLGGGYVDGDRYKTEIVLKEKAKLIATTQSATKVYKTVKMPVQQYTFIHLDEQSVLEFLPDPLIAYENAKFYQETTIHMKESSTLIYSDMITPGWSESGELFRYDWIRSKLKVYYEGSLKLFDHLYLKPGDEITGILQMEGYTHFGSFLVLSPFITNNVVHEMETVFSSFSSQAHIGWSTPMVPGLVVRILAYETDVIEMIFRAIHELIRKRCFGEGSIFLRKY
ncbi:urease accessory protein [Anoxybacillus vitaminiphilus]|jgi:urease accessory protein|uniref:Urease accessory protein UreD n=1 Tax=Paranoxybacillus vitaminiphilus TaxID=581036 RepID=A0A327Y4F3_9BACL|nr:urease accessory protein UreD [Anoxybacillus vitaminiphilus]RAK15182.1 urease accessory protein [Anoxybacillus vitaminiphilus]